MSIGRRGGGHRAPIHPSISQAALACVIGLLGQSFRKSLVRGPLAVSSQESWVKCKTKTLEPYGNLVWH